ncbi:MULTISPECIES: DUF1203 domain-containing protein [Stappiaceae]|jgi:hypothetical protein|uniref:DUF1203 domain-containing protein n=1 Tax=Roseibium aggregatum TaxID=187304 RepID=A0A0M6YCP4_9HYPH|nr:MULTISPECIES: DUF1203 domain-containing protein [Stappiaceae]NKI60607.1 DUF1203 domain-containing protein [Labrenzia sp. PO1]QFT66177.1 hypothetical protein FIU93_05280 [Labrenzia sp. THAF35]UES48496.1 DUF1203 domain-containing protein [Roseibium aggregatum]UES55613.1 DUF1203 domain-containing protein [Roseibium aggregatum]UFI04446.1 DUF1203 domain-containing protein [Roseibium aggregatum]
MFQIEPLPATEFAHLSSLSDTELAQKGIQVHISDGAFPCRVSLADAAPGTRVYLLNFEHQPGETPYRSRHAIFVADGAKESHPDPDTIPEVVAKRLLSARAFNRAHEMIDAEVVEGRELEGVIRTFFDNPQVDYIHLHFARRGCYAARVSRTAWT